MRASPFMAHLLAVLERQVAAVQCEMQLVCYGLGSFSSNNAAYQLACAVLMREFLSMERHEACLFDPIMTEDDKKVAEKMGFHVLSSNEQGQRQAPTPTLFFMPHCGKKLYQNVLLANWTMERLANVVIVGNSFAAYDDRVLTDRRASIFSALLPYLEEFPVGKVDKKWHEHVQYDAAFNDMSLHQFPSDKLHQAHQNGLFEKCDQFHVGTDEDLM